jgi:hypothetical protein
MKYSEKDFQISYKSDFEKGVHQQTYRRRDNNKIIPHIPLSGAIAKRVTGFAMIRKDLSTALEWMVEAEKLMEASELEDDPKFITVTERKSSNQIKSLFVSAVVFYTKAFSRADGRNATLQRSMLDPHFHAAHDQMMKFRNNFVVHSGNQGLEYGDSNILLWQIDDDNFSLYVQTNRAQPDFAVPRGDCKRFALLFEHVIAKAEDHYKRLATRIIEWGHKKGSRFWMTAYGKSETIEVNSLPKK